MRPSLLEVAAGQGVLLGQWWRAERRAPALRGSSPHPRAELELCAPPNTLLACFFALPAYYSNAFDALPLIP